MTTSDSWIETSHREAALSARIAGFVSTQTTKISDLCNFINDLADYLTYKKDTLSGETKPLVYSVIFNFPELKELEVSQAFPQTNQDITTNFFARLAIDLSALIGLSDNDGAVPTPSIIALDMVSLSLSIFLSLKTKKSADKIFGDINKLNKSSAEEFLELIKTISDIVWYDPCVGGGVFPLAILTVLDKLGILFTEELLQNIEAADKNPLFVEVAKIRVAMYGKANSGFDFTKMKNSLRFTVGDSLQYFTISQNLFSEPSILNQRNKDIVIGNPPYVRADNLKLEFRQSLKHLYPEISEGKVDLYNYFIAHGVQSLNQNGVLCFISPASFQKSNYGKKTRSFLQNKGSIWGVFDFDELPVFQSVSVHSSIYAFIKGVKQDDTRVYSFKELPEKNPLLKGVFEAKIIPSDNIGHAGWLISHEKSKDILTHLERKAIPLKEFVGEIYSGIKTGYKSAFFLNHQEAEFLSEDPEAKKRIKPILIPKHIKPFKSKWDGTYILLIKKGEVIPSDSLLMNHLKKHEKALKNRTDNKGHITWYGLRECNYYSVFEENKIVFPDISTKCRFSLDKENMYIPDGAFILPTDDLFLLGILNSSVAHFYFRQKCNSIGNPEEKGRLRFKKSFVRSFPVPIIDSQNKSIADKIRDLSKQICKNPNDLNLMEQINRLTMIIYDIPENLKSIF